MCLKERSIIGLLMEILYYRNQSFTHGWLKITDINWQKLDFLAAHVVNKKVVYELMIKFSTRTIIEQLHKAQKRISRINR